MAKKYIILTEAEAEAVNNDIKTNNNGVLDKFPFGGWSINAKAGKLKDGTYAMGRELIEEIEKRGGTNATRIGGVDLKNKTDEIVDDNERHKAEL